MGALSSLLAANVLMLAAGLGLVGARRAGLAYLAGIGLCSGLAAELAIVHVSYGWTGLIVTAATTLGIRVARSRRLPRRPRLGRPSIAAVAVVALLAALFARATSVFADRPLVDHDAYVMWAMKGHALQLFGWADPSLFANPALSRLHLDYPLLVPSLDAIAFRSMGGFEPQLVHLQFLLLAAAGVAALASVLSGSGPGWMVWATVAAVASAPAVLLQSLTAEADLPLAFFIAPAVAASARWLLTGDRFMLVCATFLFSVAALTKNEALILAGAAYAALLVTAPHRWRAIVASAACVEAVLLPWQLYVLAHGIHSDSVFVSAFRFEGHLGVGPIALRTLLANALSVNHWALLGPLFLIALGVAAAFGSRRLAVFGVVWSALTLAALTWIYVASPLPYADYLAVTAHRVVSSLVLGGAALTPVLVGHAWARRRQPGPRSPYPSRAD
jgi:hypothetical protein